MQPPPQHGDRRVEPASGYVGRRRDPAHRDEAPDDRAQHSRYAERDEYPARLFRDDQHDDRPDYGGGDYGDGHDGYGDDGYRVDGYADDGYADDGYGDDGYADDGASRRSSAKRRRSALIAAFSAVIVVVLAIGVFVVIRDLVSGLGEDEAVEDYQGAGGAPVSVVVPAGATTTDIANLLAEADVVASATAFLDAAVGVPAVTSIQPGTYQMRAQMSGTAALQLILDPATRSVVKIVIPEGYRIDQVIAAVAAALQADPAAVAAAAADVSQLNLPAPFQGATSAEGMFFPATYDFAPGTSPLAALQAMTAQFAAVIAETNFVAKAQAMGLTPYEALTVASMAEAEATNFSDWAKVTRVIYNRTERGEPLGIDATSVYEARLQGLDPMEIDYEVPTPYNTRRTPGFPPTPIGSPGRESLRAAVEPASGNWLYYVVTDESGTMSFTDDFAQFSEWAQECAENSWSNC